MTAQKREQLEAMNNLAAKGRAITLQEMLRKLNFSFQPICMVPRNLYKFEITFANRFGDKFKAVFYENGKGALVLYCIYNMEEMV